MQQCGFVHVRAHYVQGTLNVKLVIFDALIFPATVVISTLSASVPSLTLRLSRPECLLYFSATSETHGGFKHALTASIKTVGAGKHTQRAAGLMYADTHGDVAAPDHPSIDRRRAAVPSVWRHSRHSSEDERRR